MLPSVSSAGDATIPSASLPMALVSFDPCGRIPFGPWRPWLPKPFQGALKGAGRRTGMFSLCWWQVLLEGELTVRAFISATFAAGHARVRFQPDAGWCI